MKRKPKRTPATWLLVLWLLVSLGAGGEIVRVHLKLRQTQKAYLELQGAAEEVIGKCLQKIQELWEENVWLKEREAKRMKVI